jgi:hypothetical protein
VATDSAAIEKRNLGAELLSLAGWAALLAPVGIVLHELGHFAVGLSLGYPVRMHVGSVSGGAAIGLAPDLHVAMEAVAGPLVTVALAAIAIWGLLRRPGSRWALALAITAPIRFIVGGVYLFGVIKAWFEETAFQGTPNFDEYNAALALGLSPVWLVAAQTLGLLAYWFWVMTQPRPVASVDRRAKGTPLAG